MNLYLKWWEYRENMYKGEDVLHRKFLSCIQAEAKALLFSTADIVL